MHYSERLLANSRMTSVKAEPYQVDWTKVCTERGVVNAAIGGEVNRLRDGCGLDRGYCKEQSACTAQSDRTPKYELGTAARDGISEMRMLTAAIFYFQVRNTF